MDPVIDPDDDFALEIDRAFAEQEGTPDEPNDPDVETADPDTGASEGEDPGAGDDVGEVEDGLGDDEPSPDPTEDDPDEDSGADRDLPADGVPESGSDVPAGYYRLSDGSLVPQAAANQALEWLRTLTPEQLATLENPTPQAPVEPPPPPAPAFSEDEFVNPEVADRVNARFAQLEASQQQLIAMEEQRQVQAQAALDAQLNQAYANATAELKAELALDDSSFLQLEAATQQSGITAVLASRGGDPKDIFKRALTMTYRDQFFDQAVQAEADRRAQDRAGIAEKKAKAGAVSAKKAPISRSAPTPPAPKTEADVVNAIAADIQAAWEQEQSS